MQIKTTDFRKPGINERAASFLCGILLLLIIVITSTQAVCYWIPGWWHKEYAKYNTPQYVTGEMSLDDAVYITEQMLDYCIGRIDTLDDTMATIDGKSVPFFTEREKQHLADCRNIFLGAVKVRVVSILVIIGLILAIYYSARKRLELASGKPGSASQSEVWREVTPILAKGYIKALIAQLIFAAVLVLMGMQDFTLLFTRFHHVFFDNDLWILDPAVDNLVNVMQESVFSDAAIDIGLISAGVAAILTVISIVVLRKRKQAAEA
ncbi:MAG: DUF1461 domain-containing protein [Clostridiales bacterium]|nr:DUF1461 domain-containing protein [Clostridiales bacterium]